MTLKDLSNIHARMNDKSAKGNELETVVKDLTAING